MEKLPMYLQKRPENGIYYFRRPIPQELSSLLPRKEFHHSLGTKNRLEALKLHHASLTTSERLLAEALVKKAALPPVSQSEPEVASACTKKRPAGSASGVRSWKPKVAFESLTQPQLSRLVSAWFSAESLTTLQTYRNAFLHGTPEERNEWEQTLDAEWRELVGQSHPMEEMHTFRECEKILRKEDSGFPDPKRGQNTAFKNFYGLVRQGLLRLNDFSRAALLTGQGPDGLGTPSEFSTTGQPPSPSPLPAAKAHTLGELVADYEKLKTATKKETTVKAIALPLRFIREVIGVDTLLQVVNREHLRAVANAVLTYPTNAVQKFPGLSILQAIAEGQKQGSPIREAKTLKNNWIHILSVFNYAVKDGWMKENPAKGSWFEEHFPSGSKKSDRIPFEVEDLQKMFTSPLYTGAKDDGRGYLTPGPHIIRRGRFWVPLIGLFHGSRLQETCQLYTADVQGEGEEMCLFLREEDDDGNTRPDNSIKSNETERLVPIHPELFKMGFADYVAERRAAKDSPRLFPTMPLGKTTNRHSNPASKWCGHFVSRVAPDCKETFHCLRHAFTDAMRRAEITPEISKKLGGWVDKGGSAMNLYGNGPSMEHLRRDIAKVNYPGLDLSHLYTKNHHVPEKPNP